MKFWQSGLDRFVALTQGKVEIFSVMTVVISSSFASSDTFPRYEENALAVKAQELESRIFQKSLSQPGFLKSLRSDQPPRLWQCLSRQRDK